MLMTTRVAERKGLWTHPLWSLSILTIRIIVASTIAVGLDRTILLILVVSSGMQLCKLGCTAHAQLLVLQLLTVVVCYTVQHALLSVGGGDTYIHVHVCMYVHGDHIARCLITNLSHPVKVFGTSGIKFPKGILLRSPHITVLVYTTAWHPMDCATLTYMYHVAIRGEYGWLWWSIRTPHLVAVILYSTPDKLDVATIIQKKWWVHWLKT